MIGFAEEPIALPQPVPMGGYALRTEPSTGVNDALLAAAVVADDIAVVSLDVLAITAALERELAAALPDLHVVVSATHTHAGPGGDHRDLLRTAPYFPPSVRRAITIAATTAVRRAQRTLRVVHFDVQRGPIAGIATNRIFAATVADSPAALAIARDDSGRPVGAIVNYACHPTVLDATNRELSADYVGGLRRRLTEVLGAVPVLFLNGASGDLSTRGVRRAASFAEADRLGRIVADELLDLSPYRIDYLPPKAVKTTVSIRQRGRIDSVDVADDVRAYIQRVEPEIAATQAHRQVELPVRVARLGGIVIAALPVELFSAWHPGWSDTVFLACYSGGHHGYAVTPDTPLHAYERLSSWLPDDAGGLLVAAAEKLRQELV